MLGEPDADEYLHIQYPQSARKRRDADFAVTVCAATHRAMPDNVLRIRDWGDRPS